MDYEVMMNGRVQIGEYAPEFEADTTMGKIKLSDYRGKWLVFFSHPGSFTPVCTTEFIAFSKAHNYFKNLNTELLGLSIDSNSSHLAWVYDIYCKTGIRIPFPIVADRSGEIARKYGMISSSVSMAETVRNVYIIDPEGKIRLILIYPLNVGRFIPEILRALQALQVADMDNGVTPANWIPCQPIINKAPATTEEMYKRLESINDNHNGVSWYLSFKKPQYCIETENTEQKEISKWFLRRRPQNHLTLVAVMLYLF